MAAAVPAPVVKSDDPVLDADALKRAAKAAKAAKKRAALEAAGGEVQATRGTVAPSPAQAAVPLPSSPFCATDACIFPHQVPTLCISWADRAVIIFVLIL
jgi:hypothetical protein